MSILFGVLVHVSYAPTRVPRHDRPELEIVDAPHVPLAASGEGQASLDLLLPEQAVRGQERPVRFMHELDGPVISHGQAVEASLDHRQYD